MSVSWRKKISTGLGIAEEAYGTTVRRELKAALALLANQDYRHRCTEGLGVKNSRKLNAGLRILSDLVN